MALLADAGHNLSDVLALIIAWVAYRLGKLKPTTRFTYGLRGSSILAALFNAVLLLVAVGAIALGAIERFGDPQPIAGRSEERRVGEEGVSPCSTRWSPDP